MPPANILDRLVADVQLQLDAHRRARPLDELKARVRDLPPPPSFRDAIAGPGLSVIAEVKRASPSRGLIAPHFDHRVTARAYRDGGAQAISVLTEEKSFLGNIEYLRDIAEDLEGALPLLRKDFLFHEYQVYQARDAGASAVLLIVAILSLAQLTELLDLAGELGLDALVEVHDELETDTAVWAGAQIIGVNNRDLRTFVTDLETTARLRPLIPGDRLLVSESGISVREHAERLRTLPVDAVLVGEHLMLAEDVGAGIRALRVG